MIEIRLFEETGSFAEDKDIARKVRTQKMIPSLDRGEEVVLNFGRIESVTQSFIHALISDIIRKYGPEIINNISFKNCNDTVKKIINIVIEYMQI